MNLALDTASAVPYTAELARILALPRRVWTDANAAMLAEQMSAVLRTPGGTESLRPIQAIALYEMAQAGGLLGPMRVGSGKTLASFLAATVLQARRPLLVIPAKLREKTNRDRWRLAQHWRIPEFLRVESYEWLGREQAAEMLAVYQPDLIVADECHKLKALRKAAVARRVRRYLESHPCRFVGLTGTISKRSLHDYAHLARWALRGSCPLPTVSGDLELWADAIDERKGQTKVAHPGALVMLQDEQEADYEPREAARRAVRRRVVETPGVVASTDRGVACTLTVAAVECDVPACVDDAFAGLRASWETPDGWPITDGLAMFRHARELALGFFYVWSPRPPQPWLEARRVWAAYCRSVLSHSRTLDSELQVRRVSDDRPELREWLAVKDTFEPNTEPRWISDHAVRAAQTWLRDGPGIVWVEHVHLGDALAAATGLPFYRRKGMCQGRTIESHPPGQSLIASVASNAEGRNLQAWSRNLVLSFPPNGAQAEQLIGRTHRDGQDADEVTVDMLLTCSEHRAALDQCVRDVFYLEQSTGVPQKLLIADVIVPDVSGRRGPRWQ